MTESASAPDERRDGGKHLWGWPAAGIGLTAVAGQVLGVTAALLAAAGAVAAAVWVLGARLLSPGNRRGVALLALAGGVLVSLGAVVQDHGVPLAAPTAAGPDPGPPAASRGSPDLSGRRLTAADLAGVDLRRAVLRGAILDGLDLRGRDLAEVDAAGASFVGARLDGARLRQANLRGVSFRRACLRGADLSRAAMSGVDAAGADVSGAAVPPGTPREARAWPGAGPVGGPPACP